MATPQPQTQQSQPGVGFRRIPGLSASAQAKFDKASPGKTFMTQDGIILKKMPDGRAGFFRTKQEAETVYQDALTESRITQNTATAGRFVREKLSGLPESLVNIPAAGARTLFRGGSNVLEGLKGMGPNLGATIAAVAQDIGTESPGGPSIFMRPEFQVPARRFLESAGRTAMGTLELASPVPAMGGQTVEEVVETVAPFFGASEQTAEALGGTANALSQFAIGGFNLPRTAANTLRRIPALAAAFRGRTDPVVRSVVRTINKELRAGPRTVTIARNQTRNLERSIGEGIAEIAQTSRQRAAAQLDQIANEIPRSAVKDAPRTREALLTFLDDMGFTSRAGRSQIVPRTRRTTGVALTPAERQAARMKNLLGGLTQPEELTMMQRTGLSPRMLQDLAREDVSFQTLDQLRKDIGRIIARSKDPAVRRGGHRIIEAVKRDVDDQFQEFGPDLVRGYSEALDTFSTTVFPLEGLLNKHGIEQLTRTIEGMDARDLAQLKNALGPEVSGDLLALMLTKRIDDAYSNQGVFRPGSFRDLIQPLPFRAKAAALADDETVDRMNNIILALEQAESIISSTSRLGAFARPFAIFQVVKGNLSGTGAFVIPEVIRRSGRMEAANIIASATRQGRTSTAFEASREMLMAFEVARQSYEEASKKFGPFEEEDPQATMRQGLEGVLQRFRRRRDDEIPRVPPQ